MGGLQQDALDDVGSDVMGLHILDCAQGAETGLHLNATVDDFTARRIDARQELQQIHKDTFRRDGRSGKY
ncbi:hypothetical protein ASE26_09435 [Duganella sp. Root198D2]|nr:hypothetical protein ASD07_02765 [Duganella sp. Root336D2]KRB84279.1 hypothetical protein ASE26_09435 [Duganella sp. Root198D2]